MNKLFLNDRARNHVRIMPLKDCDLNPPTDEADQIQWCKSIYNNLKKRATNLSLHKNRSKGYLISVWEMDGLFYLIQCLRNNTGVFVNTIYISKERDDLLAIAKFLRENVESIMEDYKSQILDARDALVREHLSQQKPHEA